MTDDRPAVTDHLVAEVTERFGLGSPKTWDVLSSSWTTNVRLAYGEMTMVARLHQFSTDHDRLAAIQLVRLSAHRADLPTVLPCPGPDGNTIVTLHDGTLVELEAFVHWDRGMKSPTLLERGFATLGRLHDVLRELDVPNAARVAPHANHLPWQLASERTRRGAERIRAWGDPDLTAFAGEVESHIDAVTAAEASFAEDQTSQLVHGDFWDNNVLFRGDDLAAVIDFDFMADRWRIDDLALPIWFYLLEPGHDLPSERDLEVVRRLLQAYDSATGRPLSHAERLALPLAVARQPAWSVGRWVLELEEQDDRDHARAAAAEFAVARQLRTDLRSWQAVLAAR